MDATLADQLENEQLNYELYDTEEEQGEEEHVPSLKLPAKKSKKNCKKVGPSFCCIAKEYFDEHFGLVESLQITPRVIIHKQKLRKKSKYGLSIVLKNNALYPRYIHVFTDSPTDTTIEINNIDNHRYINPDEELEIKIVIQADKTKNINRRRNIYIESIHPNIVFEVPIIIVDQLKEPQVSNHIIFPSCTPKNKSYYELVIYNPTRETVKLKVVSTYRLLKIDPEKKITIPKRDYVKILFTLKPKELKVLNGTISAKFGSQQPAKISFDFTPRLVSVHVSVGTVEFGPTKFGRELKRIITICNEGSTDIAVNVEFLNENNCSASEDNDSTESNFQGPDDKFINDDVQSMHSVLAYNFDHFIDNTPKENKIVYDHMAYKHFQIQNAETLMAYTSEDVVVLFQPVYDLDQPFSDDLEPPYALRTKLFLAFTNEEGCTQSNWVIITGLIDGLEIELHPKVIDFRKIYLGEEHCNFIRALNIDGALNANVTFKEFKSPQVAGVTISPLSIAGITPCSHGNFHLSFYSRRPSKFNVTLHFKVTNGGTYNVTVKGNGLHIELRTFPNLVEFGSIPIAVPQKRYLLLMNPLSVPITLKVSPTDDGEEQPLVLNIKDNTDLMPITIKDPIIQLQHVNEDLRNESHDEVDIQLVDSLSEKPSYESYQTSGSVYSVFFEENVMEPIPTMALQLITALKKQKIFDKSETDKRVVQEAMTYLLNTKYFSSFMKHSNFAYMDWNAIPSDPKEIYCDSEIIYLRPNTGKSITILIIPNTVGYFHRSLTVRVCPQSIASPDESQNDKSTSLINSEFLCSKLWFEYNCCVPDIEWFNFVNLSDREIYAGEDYDFDMDFWNNSSVGGFIHFDVVPSEMTFRESIWKFYIGPDEEIQAKCCVCFQTIGPTKLWGLLKIVGSHRSYPFHIIAKVLPTNIKVTPKCIRQRIQVLEISKVHVFIDNATPTSTVLLMRLKNDENQYLTLQGGILSPKGQSIYTTLVSQFTDPDLYTNVLHIDLQFDNIVEVQISFVVEGVPIFFEPNIREGFDTGTIFTDSEENFQSNYSHYCEIVKVINKGRRAYRVNITRLKNYVTPLNKAKRKNLCVAVAVVARFDVMPKSFFLEPNSCDYLAIVASAYEECVCTAEFRIEVIDQKYPQRTHTMRVLMTATFIQCTLMWRKPNLIFNFKHTQNLSKHPYIQTCQLINPHGMPVENVWLNVTGPFRIKELYEDSFEMGIYIRLEPYEQKDIFVVLNKGPLKELFCKTVEGRINVIAYDRAQKSLPLKVNVLIPEIVISNPEVVFFTRGQEYYRFIQIINSGCLVAEYKWKRLEMSQEFIGTIDNSRDFISDMLSEIIRMVDYELDDDEETNLTLRYRKYKCRYQFESDIRNDIMDILDEIINNLDLSHKRYIVHLDMNDFDSEGEALSERGSDDQSSGTVIRQTIYEILGKLKIESSYTPSPVSSEHCFFERSIYFCDKSGILQPCGIGQCMLHIPYLKRSYEAVAVFELDLDGGQNKMLKVTVVNLSQIIKFTNDNIYLNIKPWYEMCHSKVRVFNITKYPLELKIEPEKDKTSRKDKYLAGGYAKLISPNIIQLEPMSSDLIEVECVLGFSENFYRSFLVNINDSSESHFCLRGQGVMPILSMSSNLDPIEQNPFDIAEEYRFLREIYYYEMFSSITFVDEEPKIAPLEEECTQEDVESISSDYGTISESTEDSERKKLQEIKFFKLLQSYILVNNNEELPNAIVLKQLLETAKYLMRLRFHPELHKVQQKVYQTYLKAKKTYDTRLPMNLKHFTVQSIPCELHGNILELGTLKMNSFKRFSFTLHFFGPGKLIASARTIAKIPGLYVDFKVDKNSDKDFIYWAEKCRAPEFFQKKYRNMFERLLDAQIDPKVKHAHSFDIDDSIKHQRDLTSMNRRSIDEYYNSLNMSVYADHLHHFTLCKIYTLCRSNFSGIDLNVVGLIKPSSIYYADKQMLEDFMYIDLHMGPTLPILMRGLIVK